MVTYKIERTIAEISSSGRGTKRLTLTSWNDQPAKLDLRVWVTDDAGQEKPGRGITLTEAEAFTLAAELQIYFAAAK